MHLARRRPGQACRRFQACEQCMPALLAMDQAALGRARHMQGLRSSQPLLDTLQKSYILVAIVCCAHWGAAVTQSLCLCVLNTSIKGVSRSAPERFSIQSRRKPRIDLRVRDTEIPFYAAIVFPVLFARLSGCRPFLPALSRLLLFGLFDSDPQCFRRLCQGKGDRDCSRAGYRSDDTLTYHQGFRHE
jgi:hypothetical protein